VRFRKSLSPQRFRAAARRRRQRMMRKLSPSPGPSEDATRPAWGDGPFEIWETDAYSAGSWYNEPTVYESPRSHREAGGRPPSASALRMRKWLLQGLFSLALVAAVWLIETSTHPQMAPVQYWVGEALSRDFDFAAVQAWYERQFGNAPAFLPAFAVNWFGQGSHDAEEWQPLVGRVVKPFSPQHQGIRLSAAGEGEIYAVGTGWVVDVGERPGLGMTVVVQHPRGNQTWYADLAAVYVTVDDWVYAGEAIGRAGSDGEWFLALRRQDRFVGPAAVLPLVQ